MIRKKLATLPLLLLSAIAIRSDIPPEAGFTRVGLNIVLVTNDDLGDLRLFLRSGKMVREIFVKRGERTSVEPLGGGAFYSSGTVFAIPRKSLLSYSDEPSPDRSEAMEKAIFDESVTGEKKLLDHRFKREVRTAEAKDLKDPIYNLERTSDGGVTATLMPDLQNVKKSDGVEFGIYDVKKSISMFGWLAIIVVSLGGLALAIFGTSRFLKSRR